MERGETSRSKAKPAAEKREVACALRSAPAMPVSNDSGEKLHQKNSEGAFRMHSSASLQTASTTSVVTYLFSPGMIGLLVSEFF